MENYAGSINLQQLQHDIFRNLKKSTRRFVIDIGGSLAKVAYITKKKRRLTLVSETSADTRDAEQGSSTSNLYSVTEEERESDTMHFIKFETKYLESCVHFIRTHILGESELAPDAVTDVDQKRNDNASVGAVTDDDGVQIKVTGGGAFKYTSFLNKTLRARVDKLDEITCIVRGLNFVLRNIADEAYRFERNERGLHEIRFEAVAADALFPYLLVVVGSGVSIVKVTSEDHFERVGGTCVGGGTFCGLGALLTDGETADFDELLRLADEGDEHSVNAKFQVAENSGVTCSFGKLSGAASICSLVATANEQPSPEQQRRWQKRDLVKGALMMIAAVIGQLAATYAHVHGLRKVYFGGYFIRAQGITMQAINDAIARHAGLQNVAGRVQALFLRHEGYLGAIGALLTQLIEDDAHSSWAENVANSSALPLPTDFSSARERLGSDAAFASGSDVEKNSSGGAAAFTAKLLELDKFERRLAALPLLRDPTAYQPDTYDLAPDSAARAYWIACLLDANRAFADRAYRSQVKSQSAAEDDARTRKERFEAKYVAKLAELRDQPLAHGVLTVRTLLDWREQCLRDCGFADAFIEQKQIENEQALAVLDARLVQLESLSFEHRQLELIRGVLAGNVFDWGAKTVADLLESDPRFDFDKALSVLQGRPWLVDDFENWSSFVRAAAEDSSLRGRAVIFMCDNSGFDIVCGIVPLACELLRLGAKVALVANSQPALNDVTFRELQILVKRLCAMRGELAAAVEQGRLLAMPNGQSSPCLDLRYVDADLAEFARRESVALLVLVGMGRAIHTNLNAQFACNTLKLAVLKNAWLAQHLGGSMFSVVCKFEAVSDK